MRLTAEEQELWSRVEYLWSLALERDDESIRRALHPRYVGWDLRSPTPHDRETAVQSVVGSSAVVTAYELTLLSVVVYDHIAGIVHYAYSAKIASPEPASSLQVMGKWSEVYIQEGGAWLMISVTGMPDPPGALPRATEAGAG